MSLILEFTQILNKEESNIGVLKSCNLYEIDNSKAKKGKACYIRNSDLFRKILVERDIWRGEVYNIPMLHNYLFYILAMDFESNVGFRESNDEIIFLGFDPKPIHFVVSQSIKDVPEVKSEFDELESLLGEAVENDYLIGVNWG